MSNLTKGWCLEQAAEEALRELKLEYFSFCADGINTFSHVKVPDFSVNSDYLIECKNWNWIGYYVSPILAENEIQSRFKPYPDKKKILIMSKFRPQNDLVRDMLKDIIIVEVGFMVHTNFMKKATSIIKMKLKEILGLQDKKPLNISKIYHKSMSGIRSKSKALGFKGELSAMEWNGERLTLIQRAVLKIFLSNKSRELTAKEISNGYWSSSRIGKIITVSPFVDSLIIQDKDAYYTYRWKPNPYIEVKPIR